MSLPVFLLLRVLLARINMSHYIGGEGRGEASFVVDTCPCHIAQPVSILRYTVSNAKQDFCGGIS